MKKSIKKAPVIIVLTTLILGVIITILAIIAEKETPPIIIGMGIMVTGPVIFGILILSHIFQQSKPSTDEVEQPDDRHNQQIDNAKSKEPSDNQTT